MAAEDFGPTCFPQHCWEGLVVDRLPSIDCFLGSGLDYFWLALVCYWGLAGWDDFVVQILVPTEQVEWGRGLEPLALVTGSGAPWEEGLVVLGWV